MQSNTASVAPEIKNLFRRKGVELFCLEYVNEKRLLQEAEMIPLICQLNEVGVKQHLRRLHCLADK